MPIVKSQNVSAYTWWQPVEFVHWLCWWRLISVRHWIPPVSHLLSILMLLLHCRCWELWQWPWLHPSPPSSPSPPTQLASAEPASCPCWPSAVHHHCASRVASLELSLGCLPGLYASSEVMSSRKLSLTPGSLQWVGYLPQECFPHCRVVSCSLSVSSWVYALRTVSGSYGPGVSGTQHGMRRVLHTQPSFMCPSCKELLNMFGGSQMICTLTDNPTKYDPESLGLRGWAEEQSGSHVGIGLGLDGRRNLW